MHLSPRKKWVLFEQQWSSSSKDIRHAYIPRERMEKINNVIRLYPDVDFKPLLEPENRYLYYSCKTTQKSKEYLYFALKNGEYISKITSFQQFCRIFACNTRRKPGRRCWTLNYRHESADIKERYHMDILPCVANEDYDRIFREVSGNTFSLSEANRIAIRITDKLKDDYASSTDTQTWLISNPDGYAYWFADRCKTIEQRSIRSIMDSIMPIGRYSKEKSTLQMIVQILKRHRDIRFYNDTENKPISIIITTLAAKAYNGEKDLASALVYVISNMQNYIDQDADGNFVISNPVNPRENFADKWVEKPIRKQCFFEWLSTLKQDMKAIAESTGIRLRENVGKAFGSNIAAVVSNSLAKDLKSNTNSLRVSSTGVLGTIGTKLNATNTFHGTK